MIVNERFICTVVGGLWWSAPERLSWDPPTTQTPQGHQEEARSKNSGHDQEDQQGRLRKVLEGIQHKVSTLLMKGDKEKLETGSYFKMMLYKLESC